MSILGPLLFTIHVKDLPQSLAFMFADDTKLTCTIQSVADHNQDLDCLLQWCVKWKLNLNILKCKIIHYGRNHDVGVGDIV